MGGGSGERAGEVTNGQWERVGTGRGEEWAVGVTVDRER